MNNPNPFVPKGSLLEQQSKRRSRLKLGVFCVLAVGIAGLAAMLIQGCKREEDQNQPETSDNTPPAVDTNNVPDTNLPPAEASNPPGEQAPPVTGQQPPPSTVPNVAPTVPPPVAPAPPAPTENEYVVVQGDTFSKIAKENGTTVKAIEDANPGVTPTRLRVGEKLIIPAGVSTTGGNAAGETENGIAAANGDEVYVVKPGDTLTRIAHHYGVTIKAIENENNLTTTKIKVGQKLNIPAKAEAAPENAPPAATTAPEPAPAANPPPASNPPNTAPAQQ